MLPHVTWPLVPEADESLVGFVARTCHHNGLWNAKPLMDDVGLRVSRGIGHLPRVAADLTGLATVLAVDVEWVEERRQGSARSPSARVNFHGAALRREHLDCSNVAAAPQFLQQHGYHRDEWLVSTLAACSISGEWLVQHCQQPGCRAPLRWLGPKGICRCADPDCRDANATGSSLLVPECARPGLTLAAGLVHPLEKERAASLAALPPSLRSEDRGDVFELAWVLGCLEEPDGLKAITSPKLLEPTRRGETLARGASLLTDWPASLTNILHENARVDDPGQALMRVVKTIQAVIRKPTTFGRVSSLLSDELDGISSPAFPSVLARQLDLLTGRQFAEQVGLKTSKMAMVQRANLLPRIILSEGERDLALFRPNDANDVQVRIKDRVSAQAFASSTGIGLDAVELLVSQGSLQRADDPLIQAVWPELHLDPTCAAAWREKIESILQVEPAPEGSSELFAVLRGCLPGEKPWPSLLRKLLNGDLRLFPTEDGSLNVRRCLISPEDAQKVIALPVPSPPMFNRSEWLCEADAMERLSTTGQRLRALVEAEILSISGAYHGRTYLRSEIDSIVAVSVSTLEVGAKLGLSHQQTRITLWEAGLVPDDFKFLPREVVRQALNLTTV